LRSLYRSAVVGFRVNNPHQVVSYSPKTPLKSPLVQGGTLFSSNVAPQGGMKNSLENPPYQRGKEGGSLQGVVVTGLAPNPPEVPLIQGGTVVSSNMKNLLHSLWKDLEFHFQRGSIWRSSPMR
jgi:hypothetical protein